MFLRTLGVVFSLALASCASNVPLSSAVESTPTGARLSFLDISKFDRDLSGSLQDKNASVEVEPPPNELVSRSPFAALSLVGTLITSIKTFAKFNSERIYETAKGRDAVISLERNIKGEVVITAIKFVKRTP